MKKVLLFFLIPFALISCETNQEDDPTPINDFILALGDPCNFQGRVYNVTSFLYEIPVNFNGDNVYSENLIGENNCYTHSIDFNQEDKVFTVNSYTLRATVEQNTSGDLEQQIQCSVGDGFRLLCAKNGNSIYLISASSGNIIDQGTLSDNGNVITFDFPNSRLFSPNGNEILNEDGTVTNYQGRATIRFELE